MEGHDDSSYSETNSVISELPKSDAKRRRQSIVNLSEDQIVMKYIELRAKYDNMIEAAGNKILELSNQVNTNNTDEILKTISNETSEKMNLLLDEKEKQMNDLREKNENEKKAYEEKENNYLDQVKEFSNQKLIIEDELNNMKSEKESLESFLELNTCDITSLQEKVEKKKKQT